jgi:NADPH:quinone reductase-like Zn-dependent oxidoreductase
MGLRLKDSLESSGHFSCKLISLEDAAASEGTFISLLDVDDVSMANMNPAMFESIKALLNSNSSILWVSQPQQEQDMIALGTFDGLARTVRSENPSLRLATMKLEIKREAETEIINSIVKALYAFKDSGLSGSYEPEYRMTDNLIHIPRLVEERAIDHHIVNQMSPHYETLQEFHDDFALSLQVQRPGSIDSLSFIEDKARGQPLSDYEIEVQVEAAGVNILDIMSTVGNAAVTSPMGMESAGVVVRAGAASEYHPGDRVALAYMESFKSFARTSDQCAILIPKTMSFSEAAALPVCLTTAWHALHNVARMVPGESVLIHSGAGAVGQAAIQVAQELYAEIFTVVESQEKKELLMKTYVIQDDHILLYHDRTLSVSGDSQAASLDCLASHGRFIELRKTNIHSYEKLSLYALRKNITFSVVDMETLPSSNPRLLKETLSAVMLKVKERRLRSPRPLKVYGFAEASLAFHNVLDENHSGKVILEVRSGEKIPVSISPAGDLVPLTLLGPD